MAYFKGSWLFYSPLLSIFSGRECLVEVRNSLSDELLFKVKLDPRDPSQLYMIMNNRFDLGTAMTIWSLLEKGDTFIDVGANFGYLSYIGAAKVGEEGRVVAIEPNPTALKLLKEIPQKNLQIIGKVAGRNSTDRFIMHQPFYRQTTSSQFEPDPAGEMESMRLDDIYATLQKKSIKLIKIDTEGAEIFVLEGAEQILREEHPLVIAEIFGHSKHFGYQSLAIYDYMKKFGYDHFYTISDDTNSVTLLAEPTEGQILFSVGPIDESKFQI